MDENGPPLDCAFFCFTLFPRSSTSRLEPAPVCTSNGGDSASETHVNQLFWWQKLCARDCDKEKQRDDGA